MEEREILAHLMQRKVSRRGVLAAAAAGAFLAACSKDVSQRPSSAGQTSGGVSQQLEDELNIFNWADYVHPRTYPSFEREFDIKITEDNYPSNEDALARLQAGARGYDIVVPSGYMVAIMIREGLLEKVEPNQMENAFHRMTNTIATSRIVGTTLNNDMATRLSIAVRPRSMERDRAPVRRSR